MIKVFEKTVMRGNECVNLTIFLEMIDICILATDKLKKIVDLLNGKDRRKIDEANSLLSSAREIIAELNIQL